MLLLVKVGVQACLPCVLGLGLRLAYLYYDVACQGRSLGLLTEVYSVLGWYWCICILMSLARSEFRAAYQGMLGLGLFWCVVNLIVLAKAGDFTGQGRSLGFLNNVY
jgi:hypothetical protein